MRIVMIRGNKVDPDPRVEKEANTLIKDNANSVVVLAWDRTEEYDIREERLHLKNGDVPIIRFGIPAIWGGGMRRNAKSAILFHIRARKWLWNHIDSFDCIHATSFTIGHEAIKFQKKGKKLVYDIYDYYADIHNSNKLIHDLIKRTEDNVINHADVTIICSESRKEQIKGSCPRKLCVIHNSPSVDELSLCEEGLICQSQTSLPRVVYVGNLIEERYIQSLLEIASNTKSFELHIGGFGVLEELVATYAKTYTNIFFYGKMKYSDVLKLEKECDIMVALYDPRVPNHKFAAPNKFYEALFIGKPIIMFKNTGMDPVIKENAIGEICDFSKESLNDAITKIIEKRDKWDEIKNKDFTLYQNKYSWDIMSDRLRKIYADLV